LIVALENDWERLRVVFESLLSSSLGYIHPYHFRGAVNASKDGSSRYPLVGLMKTISLELWLQDLVSRNLISVSYCSTEFKSDRPSSERQSVANISCFRRQVE